MTALRKLNNTQHGDKNMLTQIKNALKKLFGFVDANKDGKIQWSEIIAALVKSSGAPDEASLKAAVDESMPIEIAANIVEAMKAEFA